MQNGQVTYTDKGVLLSLEMYNQLLSYQAEYMYLKQEIAQLKRMIFGSRSERHIGQDPSQLSLGLDIAEIEAPEVETEQISYSRQKTNEANKGAAVRLALPSHLHREEHVIEPLRELDGSKKIGEVITEVLEYTPGKFYVQKYIRPKYLTPEKEIVIAELPSLPIPRGNAGPGLLAHLLISKFVDHLPFYRQVQQFRRQDISIAESTISGWFSSSCRLLEPLYDTLVKKVQASNYINADETPIPVQTKDKPGATHKGYHWVYYSPPEKLVCFDYRKSRGREGPDEFLKHFSGTLQTDGYSAYDLYQDKAGINLLACMAHARRKFEQAKENDPVRAEHALGLFRKLYLVERKAREEGLSAEQRQELRQKESIPVLDELERWMKEQLPDVLPKSGVGKAISYTLGLWKRLSRYVENGAWEIDNNMVENSIRPVALGRKNYLFAGSHEAAQQAAMMYSFLGTCKINNVEPFTWLKNVLSRIQDHSIQKLDEFLPLSKA